MHRTLAVPLGLDPPRLYLLRRRRTRVLGGVVADTVLDHLLRSTELLGTTTEYARLVTRIRVGEPLVERVAEGAVDAGHHVGVDLTLEPERRRALAPPAAGRLAGSDSAGVVGLHAAADLVGEVGRRVAGGDAEHELQSLS